MAVRNRNARTIIAVPSDFSVGGAAVEKSAQVQLAHADILVLNATPFQFVAAPGVGKWLEFLSAAIFFDWTADYTSPGLNISVDWGNGSEASKSFSDSILIAPGGDSIIMIPRVASAAGVQETPMSTINTNLRLFNHGGPEFGGGNAANRWYVKVAYREWTVGF